MTDNVYSFVQYVGDGTTRNFSVPFDYLERDHVVVKVNGESASFEWLDSNTIRLSEAPSSGVIIEVRRETSHESRRVIFHDGSVLTEDDLNDAVIHTFYMAQEAVDLARNTLLLTPTGEISARGRRLTDLAEPQDPQDAATKGYVDAIADGVEEIRDQAEWYKDRAEDAAIRAEYWSSKEEVQVQHARSGQRVLEQGQTQVHIEHGYWHETTLVIWLNGVKLRAGVDYEAPGPSYVWLLQPAQAGDVFEWLILDGDVPGVINDAVAQAEAAAQEAEAAAQEAVNTVADTAKKTANLSDLTDLKEARSNLGTFSSVADVEASHIPPVLDSIRTNGYHSPGDGGGALYKRVSSEPSHNSKVQSADGSWWTPVVPFGYAFDSVSDMQASRLVTPGARVRTLGYYTPGDGGGNDYEIVAAGTGTDDGGTFIDLPGSGLQAKGLQGIEVNVLHYGAGKPDGSDCSSNIQSAVNRLKSLHLPGTTSKIVFPPFTYNIESPIDMTRIRYGFKEWHVDARGAVFNIKTTGSVGFDLFGSRKCIWTGGVLIGDDVNTPSIGLQIGRDGTGTASDNHVFKELCIWGHFTFCCLYNGCSEGSGFISVSLDNRYDSLQSYCLVQDGSKYWDVPSQFVPTLPQGTNHSFNENYFINLDARKGTSGSAVWMSRTSRHKYYSSYVVTYDDAGFVVDAAHKTRGLYLDCHVETASGDGGPEHYIRFESDSGVNSALCQDLMIQEHVLHAKSLLGKRNVNEVVLENVNISVLSVHGNVVNPSFIDGPTDDWTIYGSLHLCSGLNPSSNFVGRVFDHNQASDLSFTGRNEVVHTNMDDGTTQYIGDLKIAKQANGLGRLMFTEPATGDALCRLVYNDSDASFLLTIPQSGELLYIRGGGVYPGGGQDGLMSLGSGQRRWSQVYAVSGTINTSDAREKTPIRPLTEAERNVAIRLSRLPGVYQWLSAIAQKGEEGARLHVGVTAQDVKAAFDAEGLDGFRYGVLCWDEWDAEEAEFDEDGNVLTPPREAGDRYGVRYDELAQWQAAGWNARLESLEISGD